MKNVAKIVGILLNRMPFFSGKMKESAGKDSLKKKNCLGMTSYRKTEFGRNKTSFFQVCRAILAGCTTWSVTKTCWHGRENT